MDRGRQRGRQQRKDDRGTASHPHVLHNELLCLAFAFRHMYIHVWYVRTFRHDWKLLRCTRTAPTTLAERANHRQAVPPDQRESVALRLPRSALHPHDVSCLPRAHSSPPFVNTPHERAQISLPPNPITKRPRTQPTAGTNWVNSCCIMHFKLYYVGSLLRLGSHTH